MNTVLTLKAPQILLSIAGVGIAGFVIISMVNSPAESDGGHAHSPDAGAHTHGEQISGGSDSAYPVVTVVQPQQSDESDAVIEASGQVFAAQHADIYPRREGIVQNLSVNLGDRVTKGQVVASLQPDKDQAELGAELAFKKKELEIARQRLTVSSESNETIAEISLDAGEKNKAARVQKIDAEIQSFTIAAKQAESSIYNAAYDLIEAATILMYTQTDAISRFNDYGPYDYYRRRDIFYPKDDEAKVVEQKLLALYRALQEDTYKQKPLELVTLAMDTASDVRGLTANASKNADYSDENTNQRGEISAVVDHLADLSKELVTSTSGLSVLKAEKQSIVAESTQDILKIKGEGRESGFDIALLEAEVERIQNQMGAARTIYAPFSGVITKRHISIGDSVDLDKPLFTLVDNENMFVRFNVTETDLPFIEEGTVITFAPTSAPSHLHRAIIARIAQSIDPETRSILIEADLEPEDEDGHALSQMTVRTYIPLSHDLELFSVPEQALELSGSSNRLWIVNEDVEAETRTVKVQYIHNGNAYIQEGLTGEEWIIISSPVDMKEGLEIDTTTAS
ncbi:MAG: efflux RND transporter periplasmic adaptor subunit [bacterium]|nr:efflux RND transporter periplasmic adaptor subunit [bacterium]MDA1292535.1 efflux RND transporter periplasmic adaptor subunit [bacterium]